MAEGFDEDVGQGEIESEQSPALPPAPPVTQIDSRLADGIDAHRGSREVIAWCAAATGLMLVFFLPLIALNAISDGQHEATATLVARAAVVLGGIGAGLALVGGAGRLLRSDWVTVEIRKHQVAKRNAISIKALMTVGEKIGAIIKNVKG